MTAVPSPAARIAAAALAVAVGGGVGATALSPASAGAAVTGAAVAGTPVRASIPVAESVVPAAVPVAAKAAAAATCRRGSYQKAVEGYLKKLGGFGSVKVDGKQSAADCAAIRKFQKRYDIRPAAGLAGPTTNDVAKRLAGTSTKACKAKKTGTTICVDLTSQTVYVLKNGKVSVKPTVTRTGMKGYRTPTGTFKINKRMKKEWSNPYKVWMPYWQRFVGGVGLHQTTTYLHDGWRGSHGCVNLLGRDAKALYGLGRIGMTVKVFGRRSGT
jgi:lipoprotein-anchoring transpeptidase ErfK/SrfK